VLIKQKLDLCDQVTNIDLECPLKKGPIQFTKDVDLPSRIPPVRYNPSDLPRRLLANRYKGNYKALAHAFTKDDKEVTCLEAEIHFGASSFSLEL
jgi:hypothetical protein